MKIPNARKIRKALVAIGGVIGVAASALTDGQLDVGETAAVVVAVLTAAGVYGVPNETDGPPQITIRYDGETITTKD